MTYAKINDVLSDIIGSAISDNDTFYEDPVTHSCSDNYLEAREYDIVVKQAVTDILQNKNIDIRFKESK